MEANMQMALSLCILAVIWYIYVAFVLKPCSLYLHSFVALCWNLFFFDELFLVEPDELSKLGPVLFKGLHVPIEPLEHLSGCVVWGVH